MKTMTMKMLAAGALAISLQATGCAVATDDNEPVDSTGASAQAIINGNTDPNAAYRAVTLTISITPSPSTYYVPSLCTGTLIASAWVLTAAHCVSDVTDGIPLAPSQFFVQGAGAVSGVYVMPGWSGKPVYAVPGSADVALLHLASPVNQLNDQNLACPQVDATHGCTVSALTALPPSAGTTIHCVSNGPRTPGGSFHGSGAADAADFIADNANRLIGTPWYVYSPNASGQTLIQSDEGGGCFAAPVNGTSIRGPLVTVNSFDSAGLTVPPSATHREYATSSDTFSSWVSSVIPPLQFVQVRVRGGIL